MEFYRMGLVWTYTNVTYTVLIVDKNHVYFIREKNIVIWMYSLTVEQIFVFTLCSSLKTFF